MYGRWKKPHNCKSSLNFALLILFVPFASWCDWFSFLLYTCFLLFVVIRCTSVCVSRYVSDITALVPARQYYSAGWWWWSSSSSSSFLLFMLPRCAWQKVTVRGTELWNEGSCQRLCHSTQAGIRAMNWRVCLVSVLARTRDVEGSISRQCLCCGWTVSQGGPSERSCHGYVARAGGLSHVH